VKFDIFYQLPQADSQNARDRYRELIDEAAEADRLGFDSIWLAEVHFAPHFSIMPSPMMLLAAIAERTNRLKLGLAVNLVPLHHPVRLAEETAMLDVMSGGRVVFGAGRGAFALNYRGYGVGLDESRDLFVEGIDFFKAAWSGERISFRGRHFNADNVQIVPRPLQRPHPPIRLAANSEETFAFAGEHGYPIFAGGPVNPFPVLGQRLKIYDDALARAGRARPDDWLAGLLMVHAGRDRVAVRTIVEPSLKNYFRSVLEIIEPTSNLPFDREEFGKMRARLESIQYETVESIMAAYGEPGFIADRINQLSAEFGFKRLVCWFETGGLMGHEAILRSMRLFADKVMPAVK
jgi:alkanesulfonate monooxygenase SsuD/methylene tetrahydromethanopterin reductase-like flavin-dependent oxidoreductase (luciferase family)